MIRLSPSGLLAAAVTAVVALVVACGASSVASPAGDGSGAPPPAAGSADGAPAPPVDGFDGSALPQLPDGGEWHAIVDMDLAPGRVLYGVSDVHGGYDRLAALLTAVHLTSGTPASPAAMNWSAGNAILVVTGDLFDKGPQGVQVIDALRALEASAAAAGGAVIVLLGNHEAEFFVDPHNSKATAADGFDTQLAALGIDPVAVATGTDPRGAWLRARPLGARVGQWFFSHAGNTKGRSLADLDLALRSAIAAHADYNDPELVGADSILEARAWYTTGSLIAASAQALGVTHMVFGHDPNALGARGAVGTAEAPLLLRIDCGMSPDVNDSSGCVLRVRRDGASEVAEELTAKGAVRELWRGP